jgi:hypothetical protein
MPVEIIAALASIKPAFDIVSGLLKMKTDAAVQEKAVELNSKLLDVQRTIGEMMEAHTRLVEENTALKGRVATFDQWQLEKESYEIVPTGRTNGFLWARKPVEKESYARMYLCTVCFEDRKKSILGWKDAHTLRCPRCKAEFGS